MDAAQAAPQAPRTLVKKLAEVMALVDRVPKSGRNNFHNYDYATEADIASAVRQGMAERHLMLVPSVQKTDWEKVPSEKGGKDQRLCTLTVEFRMMDGESGEAIAFTVIGQGQDSGDKATYKAMTGAEKYALLKLFLIPTGDDPEKDTQERKPQPQPQQRGQSRTQQVKEQVAAKAQSAPEPLTVKFGTYRDRPAHELTVLELTAAVSEGRAALEKDPNAKWAPKARANVAALQRALDLRMNTQASGAQP